MELYDSKFVYFDWNSNLEGKEVFLADNIEDLKQAVTDHSVDCVVDTVTRNDAAKPFLSQGCLSDAYRFVYYDPYHKLRYAQEKEGAKIYHKVNNEWVLEENCVFDDIPENYTLNKPAEIKELSQEELLEALKKACDEDSGFFECVIDAIGYHEVKDYILVDLDAADYMLDQSSYDIKQFILDYLQDNL